VQGVYHGYAHFLDAHFFSVPTFLITIGAIIFVIAFFGCCGAYKENYCMVLTVSLFFGVNLSINRLKNSSIFHLQFSVLLGLVFVLELSAGISGYVLRNDTKQILMDSLNKTMPEYSNITAHKDTVVMWDEIQERVRTIKRLQ
jgi:CD63 antigen